MARLLTPRSSLPAQHRAFGDTANQGKGGPSEARGFSAGLARPRACVNFANDFVRSSWVRFAIDQFECQSRLAWMVSRHPGAFSRFVFFGVSFVNRVEIFSARLHISPFCHLAVIWPV